MSHPDPSSILDAALGFIPRRAHLRDCAGCREELDRVEERLRDLQGHYAALENPSTEMLEARVMRALRASPAPAPSRPLSARLSALVAASLVMGALVWWSIVTRPSGPEVAVRPEISPRPQEPAPEEIAARINGEILTWKEVSEGLKGIKPGEITEELRNSQRRQLAEVLLFRQFVDRKKLNVSDVELDQAIEQDVRSNGGLEEYERMLRLRFGTAAKAREARRWELLAGRIWAYVRQNEGTDPELRGAGFLSEAVPEAELRAYYDSHAEQFQAVERISFMRVGVLLAGAGEEEKKRPVLESVLRKYEKGAEFSMLAFFYSEVRRAKEFRDMNVTRKDLEGLYTPETIRYLFEALKEKEVSPILRDGNTLNLFRLEQKIVQKAEPFEEARGRILAMFRNQIQEKNRKKFRDLLRRQARIEPPDLFGDF